MDLKSCLFSLCVIVQLPLFLTAPAGDGKSSVKSGDSESLRGIIIELENVLYKLKDYSRSMVETESIKGVASQDEEEELPLSKNSLPLSSSSSSSSSQGEEVSLKDAIEYLVSLAKQKKAEKRDHDIPFPFTGKNKNVG